MKLTDEDIAKIIEATTKDGKGDTIELIRTVESEVLRLNGIGEGERSYACDHDDAVHCWNCYAVTPQQAASVPDGWQPIETAPKDGTNILVFEYDHITTACWYGGWRLVVTGTHSEDSDCYPSHWMPLPAAPKVG